MITELPDLKISVVQDDSPSAQLRRLLNNSWNDLGEEQTPGGLSFNERYINNYTQAVRTARKDAPVALTGHLIAMINSLAGFERDHGRGYVMTRPQYRMANLASSTLLGGVDEMLGNKSFPQNILPALDLVRFCFELPANTRQAAQAAMICTGEPVKVPFAGVIQSQRDIPSVKTFASEAFEGLNKITVGFDYL